MGVDKYSGELAECEAAASSVS